MSEQVQTKRAGKVRIVIGAILIAYGLIGLATLPAALVAAADDFGGPLARTLGATVPTFGALVAGVLLLVFGILAYRRG